MQPPPPPPLPHWKILAAGLGSHLSSSANSVSLFIQQLLEIIKNIYILNTIKQYLYWQGKGEDVEPIAKYHSLVFWYKYMYPQNTSSFFYQTTLLKWW